MFPFQQTAISATTLIFPDRSRADLKRVMYPYLAQFGIGRATAGAKIDFQSPAQESTPAIQGSS
jgi:hypothetical protein